MPLNRDPLAREREIFESEDSFRDERDTMTGVGVSLFIFGGLEYAVEIYVDTLPGGLMLPLGFLLFWAFYYTYYQPNQLDNRLQPLSRLGIPSVAGMIFGVAVWFVKVTVVGIFDFLFVSWWRQAPAPAKARTRPVNRETTGSYNTNTGSYRSYRPRSEGQSPPRPEARPTSPPTGIPLEMVQALTVLGINEGIPAWDSIHKRYRELAKRYHPDLNQEITRAGNRFIKVDQAYRKLTEGKGKFFK